MNINMEMIDKFCKGLMLAVLAGYAVALIVAIATSEYKTAADLVVKGTIIVGLNLLRRAS